MQDAQKGSHRSARANCRWCGLYSCVAPYIPGPCGGCCRRRALVSPALDAPCCAEPQSTRQKSAGRFEERRVAEGVVPGRSDARRACSASPGRGCPAESAAAARARSADPAPTAASGGLSSRSQRVRRAALRPGGRRSRGRLSGIDGACRRAPCRRRNPGPCTGAPRASPAADTTTLSANPPTVLVADSGQILCTSRGLDLGSSGGSLGSLLYPVWLRTRQARSRCDVPEGSCSYEPSGAIFVPGGGAEQTRKRSVSGQHKRDHCGGWRERTEVLYRDVMSHILWQRLGARHVRHVEALLPLREGLRQHGRLIGRHERAVRWWLVLLRRRWSPAQSSARPSAARRGKKATDTDTPEKMRASVGGGGGGRLRLRRLRHVARGVLGPGLVQRLLPRIRAGEVGGRALGRRLARRAELGH